MNFFKNIEHLKTSLFGFYIELLVGVFNLKVFLFNRINSFLDPRMPLFLRHYQRCLTLSLLESEVKNFYVQTSTQFYFIDTLFYKKSYQRVHSQSLKLIRVFVAGLAHQINKFEYLYADNFHNMLTLFFTNIVRRSFSFGFLYIIGACFILLIDACITDDEPLWEPVEWSLIQSWLLFTFIFSWVAENLIVSRYGSYTGRDKRVWMSWYKSFWMIEGFYILNYGITCLFIIVPFYYETNYSLSFVYSWWHWYSRVFFYKFLAVYSLILVLVNLLQINVSWMNWKSAFISVAIINLFLGYLLYTHFIITFFGYFTDPIWYQKVRPIDYIQLSHEPSRWGWGSAKKDHFTYHNVKTVFWFKNDGPFASSFLLFHLFFFVCLFLTFFWWITLLRKIFSTKEIPVTFLTYCASSLRQFYFFFLWLYIFIFVSYLSNYLRLPVDVSFSVNTLSWFLNFLEILFSYPKFLFSIFLSNAIC